MTEPTLEELTHRAVAGDRGAVEALVRELEAPVYALSLRMLWHPQDAEDATQEILVRTVTRVSQFDSRSRVKTWVYRIAANYLLDVKRSCAEREELNFDAFGRDLLDGLSEDGPSESEHSLLVEELKVGCTLAMLQCLDRAHRIAYVLGELFDLPAPEAAEALSLDPAAFRKRLQRAREAIESFTRSHCGLADDGAPCSCHRRVSAAVKLGRVRSDRLLFAKRAASFLEARSLISKVEHAQRAVELHRRAYPHGPSRDIARLVVAALEPAP